MEAVRHIVLTSFGQLTIWPSGLGSVGTRADHRALLRPSTLRSSRLRPMLLHLIFDASRVSEERRQDMSGRRSARQQANE